MSASLKHQDMIQDLQIDIEKNLESESEPDHHRCCIYTVPEPIRRVNKEAYTPQLISIGPLHNGNKELANMEKGKRRYMKSFLDRITIEKEDEIFSFIKDNENNIRNCYAETSTLKSPEYIIMILYDVVFVIEFFLRSHEGTTDSFLSISTVRYNLGSDLELLENQLPYFVLEEIHRLAFVDSDIPTFMELSCSFFEYFQGSKLVRLTPQLTVKHFTDWRRSTLLQCYSSAEPANGWIKDLPCAVKLQESGVKFECIQGEHELFNIRFEKRKQQISCFEEHVLRIPNLHIHDETELLLRNMMAWEQCNYPRDTKICNYVRLMDYLIDTEKDVDLLVGNGIISNYTGDNASIANMFNKLGLHAHLSASSYYNMCEDLKGHCNNPWNKKKATLRRVYFNNLWRGTATIAAVILLLLTVIQTICSILQVV